MKTKTLLFGLAGIALFATSCNLESDDENNYLTNTYNCCNLVIPADGDAFATNASYNLSFFFTSGTLSVSTSNLSLGYSNFSFSTSAMNSETLYYTVNNTLRDVTTFKDGVGGSNGFSVQNLNGYISSIVNVLGEGDPVGDYPFVPYNSLVMSYIANHDYTVKTFMPDAVYTGETTIRTVGATDVFANSGIRYRVVFSSDLKKASIIFYNAKFADRMPVTINFVLKDLNVQFTKSGYVISAPEGESVTPYLYEGNALTPAPNYQFTSFSFVNSSADLTEGSAMYTVQIGNAQYIGSFSGYYVLSEPKE